MEHIVVFDKEKNIVLSDGMENHSLSAEDVLSELARLGIIEFEVEEIKGDEENEVIRFTGIYE